MTEPEQPQFGRPYRRMMLGIIVLGALLQLLLGGYFLGVGHSPTPRDLPVGIVAPPAQTQILKDRLETDGSFAVTAFRDEDSLRQAVTERIVTGGFVVTTSGVQAVVATAAGAAPAAVIRTTAAKINGDSTGGQTFPADVAPLPPDDANGASIGYLLQVLSLGGAIASLGLGRLVPQAPRSLRRGLGHAGALIVYSVASAAIALALCSVYGVASGADQLRLFFDFALTSLAFTASTAGFVALLGPVGSAAGVIYFLIGSSISGASIPWDFLPPFWAALGAWLPTGGGALVIRDTLYFPDASAASGYLCLGLYAGVGLTVVLVFNALGNYRNRNSVVDVDVLTPVVGPK